MKYREGEFQPDETANEQLGSSTGWAKVRAKLKVLVVTLDVPPRDCGDCQLYSEVEPQ